MARHAVTTEDVAEAVLALKASGHPVTTVNVRRELGRGSYSTINAHLETLGAKQAGRPRSDDAMPTPLRTVCDAFGEKLWLAVRKHARTREETTARPLQVRVRELTAQLARSRELCERLEYEAVQLRHDMHAASLQGQSLATQLAQAREDLAVEQRLRQHHEAAHASMEGKATRRAPALGKSDRAQPRD